MRTTEERLMRMEDEAAIKKLADKFAMTTTIGDHGGFKKLWKEDAVFKINQPANHFKKGIDEISALIMDLRDEKDFFVQFVHSGVIQIEGDYATARWIIHEVAQGPGEKYYSNYSICNDKLEKIDGNWFFSSREFDYVWLDFSAFSGKAIKLPAYK